MEYYLFKEIKPVTELSNLIQNYWIGEFENKSGEEFTHIATAQSTSQILIYLDGEFGQANGKSFTIGFHGQTILPNQHSALSSKAKILGIQLTPWAIPILFSMPAYELTNKSLEVADIIGCCSTELKEIVFSAKTDKDRTDNISSFFTKRLSDKFDKYRRFEYIVKHIHKLKGFVEIDELINISCLSSRQFERKFKETVGFSAQTFIRIIRFENAIREFSPHKKITDLALECGYFDQAHFNRDFKLFTGLSPRQYFSIEY
jgi:AraC-like DNA-binding protein